MVDDDDGLADADGEDEHPSSCPSSSALHRTAHELAGCRYGARISSPVCSIPTAPVSSPGTDVLHRGANG